MLRAVPPDPEILAWLWSHEGQVWSSVQLKRVRHGAGVFAEVKNDHECHLASLDCTIFGGSPYADEAIHQEIARYGMNGVPLEWKRRLPCSD